MLNILSELEWMVVWQVMKKKKIFRNVPWPCGSGKKYGTTHCNIEKRLETKSG
jgi:hypothetical protein